MVNFLGEQCCAFENGSIFTQTGENFFYGAGLAKLTLSSSVEVAGV
jgi:hypothetical protein